LEGNVNVSDAVSNRWVLATVGAVFGVILALTLIGRASAGFPEPQCESFQALTCIELAPETDTNTVGDEHVVTATVTFEGEGPEPIGGVDVVVLVIEGPNAGELAVGTTDVEGKLSLAYTGAEPGTDEIAALACFEPPIDEDQINDVQAGTLQIIVCDVEISDFIVECLAEPTVCLNFVTDPSGLCSEIDYIMCDTATKDWVEAPTPSATLEPTATPAQTAAPAAQLPATGGPTSSSGFPLASAMALTLAGAALLAGGVGLVRRAR
jgi:hypothetical protein